MVVETKKEEKLSSVDTKEFEFAETTYVRDIENRVFQAIVLQCLADIKGITLLDESLFDQLLVKGGLERARGVSVEQDNQKQTVSVRVEINICYGIPIPKKAEEIQTKIAEEINRLTALHVSCVHVIFKNVIPGDPNKKMLDHKQPESEPEKEAYLLEDSFDEEYSSEYPS